MNGTLEALERYLKTVPGEHCTVCETNSIRIDTINRKFCRECARRKRFVPNNVTVNGDYAMIFFGNGGSAKIDAPIVHIITGFRWWRLCGRGKEYAATRVHGISIPMHWVVLGVYGHMVDHKNGNGLDNRMGNLRLATMTQNQQNRKNQANNTTGFKGVHRRKENGKYRVRITVNGDRMHIGDFDIPSVAGEAYRSAALKFHGEFARV